MAGASAAAAVGVAPIAAALAAGVADAGDPDTRVVDLSSAHRVYAVRTPTRSVVVKMPQGRGLAAETFVYRMASWLADLAAAVPPVLLLDERRQVVVLESVGSPARPDPATARALGALLARVHRATAGLPLFPTASAGVLHLPHAEPSGTGLVRAEALVRQIQADPVLRQGLASAHDAWQESCLVHGDVKWSNVGAGDGGVRLLDWELSGGGDPMWDLACLLASAMGDELGTALCAGYGQVDAARLVRYVPARLVHTALEYGESGNEALALETLAEARDLLAHPRRFRAMLAAWTSSASS